DDDALSPDLARISSMDYRESRNEVTAGQKNSHVPWKFLMPADADDFFVAIAKNRLLAGRCPQCGRPLDGSLHVERVGRHRRLGTRSHLDATEYSIQACDIPICDVCYRHDVINTRTATCGFATAIVSILAYFAVAPIFGVSIRIEVPI